MTYTPYTFNDRIMSHNFPFLALFFWTNVATQDTEHKHIIGKLILSSIR